jgi:hypothetical protein
VRSWATLAAEHGVVHCAKLRSTQFRLPSALGAAERPPITAVYAALAEDEARNDLIFDDVLRALEEKRSPVILTERRDHVEYLRDRFSRFVRNLVVLKGGMSKTDRNASDAILRKSVGQERLILATGATSAKASTIRGWIRYSLPCQFLGRER